MLDNSKTIQSNTSNSHSELPVVLLWVSAFLIIAMIIIQAGRLESGNKAFAEMAAAGSEFTLMTTKGGSEEMLYVLEGRTGNLYVYEPALKGINLLSVEQMDLITSKMNNQGGN